MLLINTIGATGLAGALREALDPWTKQLAEHHAGKVLLDLGLTLAVGGEVASDTDLLRSEADLFGPSPRPRPSPARRPKMLPL